MHISSGRALAICAALGVAITALQADSEILPPELRPYAALLVLVLIVVVAALRPVEQGKRKPAKHG